MFNRKPFNEGLKQNDRVKVVKQIDMFKGKEGTIIKVEPLLMSGMNLYRVEFDKDVYKDYVVDDLKKLKPIKYSLHVCEDMAGIYDIEIMVHDYIIRVHITYDSINDKVMSMFFIDVDENNDTYNDRLLPTLKFIYNIIEENGIKNLI